MKNKISNLLFLIPFIIITFTLFCNPIKAIEAETLLKSLTVNGYTLDFNPNNFDYDLEILENEIELNIEATPANEDAKVTINNNHFFDAEKGTITITISKDGYTSTAYNINFQKYLPEIKQDFNYTGNSQAYTIPYNAKYRISLWGASGRHIGNAPTPGLGGYTSGAIDLAKNANLYFYVGESGNLTTSNKGSLTFNGGGYTHGSDDRYGRGGGATDVRLTSGNWNDFNSLKSRIMVAGGGGSGHNAKGNIGGDAGGLISYKGNGSASTGKAATQTSGYAFGYGGPGLASQAYSGSGSGYYGGASSTTSPCDVSYGGSSFISGHLGSDAIAANSTTSNIIHTGNPDHYSGLKFTDTVMIDGKGHVWTDVLGEYVGMPTHDNTSTMIGNLGNGFARIELIKLNNKDNVLSSLTSNIGTFDKKFDMFEQEYTLTLGPYEAYVQIDAALHNETASLIGTGEYFLENPGDTKDITIAVTSEFGDIRNYNIHLVREELNEDSTKLKTLAIKDDKYFLDSRFASLKTDYTVTIPQNELSLDFVYTTYQDSEVVTIKNNVLILEKNTLITITVTNKDAEPTIYKINVQKDSSSIQKKAEFTFTGNYQKYIAPRSGDYRIKLWGASGRTDNIGNPGLGGYTEGSIYLEKDTVLYIYVGESGNVTSTNYGQFSFNGGGYTHNSSPNYGRGGGATDIRLVEGNWNDFNSLKSRIMVAGGGGSGGNSESSSITTANGGAAGGLTSYRGNGVASSGRPATQISGYAFGYGGPGLTAQAYSGSGGGYYGGASSTNHPCDVTYGGSSFISGHTGSNAIASNSSQSNIIHTNQPNHYSGLIFTDTKMIDGNGYNWTDNKGDYVGMPTHDKAGTMSGNTGNGYAIIYYPAPGNNNFLSNIVSSRGEFDKEFDPGIYDYNLTIDTYDDNVNIGATAYDNNASIKGIGKYKIEYGETKTVTITVTSEGGEDREYHININRRPLGENEHTSLLSKLEIVGYEQDMIPEFKSKVLEYNVTISSTKIDLSLITKAYDPEAEIIITGNELMLEDKGTITITVREPNSPESIYKINYTKTKILANYEFPYIGGPATFIAPVTGDYEIALWGASGRYIGNNAAPGGGGYTKGIIHLEKDEILYVYVGESGNINASNFNQMSYNGGGYSHYYDGRYGRGGGATDIRLTGGDWSDFNSLKTRIMVAGGGGSGHAYAANSGGAAGGLISLKGNGGATTGRPGTQTSGFAFGYGGPGLGSQAYSGSGGGYFGGASSTTSPCDISYGGSSFISGHNGSNAIAENSTQNNIINTNNNVHYSGKYFKNTVMIDGEGYNWTTNRGDYVGMPSIDGTSFMNGNIGDGYAKINLVELSSNNYLEEITINTKDDKEIPLNFDPIIKDYTITLDEFDTDISVKAKSYDKTASIMGEGDYEIPAGTTVITLTVTAEDGSVRTYTLNINREASTDPRPKDIKIENLIASLCSLQDDYCNYTFDADTLTYDILLPWDIYELELKAELKSKFQTLEYLKIDGSFETKVDDGTIEFKSPSASFKVAITSEDKNYQNVYTYNFRRDENGNNNLKLITITDPDVIINGFNPRVYEYYISVDGEYDSFKLEATPENKNATVEIIGDINNLAYGLNDIKIRVTAPNGLKKDYILHVQRKINTNVFLSNLEVKYNEDTLEITPEFNSFINNYTLEVENYVDKVSVIATPENPASSHVSIPENLNLVTGRNTFHINVTDTTGSGDVNVYVINIIRKKNGNAQLKDLKVTDYDFTTEFDPAIKEYYINIGESVTNLEVIAEPMESTTTYTVKGNTNINEEYAIITINTQAENKTTDTYKIYVSKSLSDNNYLAELNIDNELITDFNKETLEYYLTVDSNTESIFVEGVKENLKATVNGNGIYYLQTGDNTIIVTVTSETLKDREYILHITKKMDDNTNLLRVENNRGSIVTSPAPDHYIINVQNEIDSIEIKGIPESPNATVQGNRTYYNLKVGENNFTLTVTAEDNITTKDYQVTVIRDKSINDDLTFLYVVEGGLRPIFNETTIYYDVTVPNNIETPTIEAITEDKDATYEIINNGPLTVGEAREVIVRVTAAAGNTKDYILSITREEATTEDLDLLYLETNRGDLTPTFSPDITNYTLEVENDIKDITITATSSSENVIIEGLETYNLRVGKNALSIFVIGESGIEKDYQIVVTRKPSKDATLASLVVKGLNLNPKFSKENTAYSLTTPSDYLEFTNIKTSEPDAKYEILDNENFAIGTDNIVTIRVTAPDNETTLDYIIHVTKEASKNNNLASLEVVGYTLTPTFHKGITYYTVNVGNEINAVNIKARPEDPKSTLTGTGVRKVIVGTNTFQIEVTSEAEKTKIYTIVVTKDGSNNNYLSSLYSTEGTMKPIFNKEIIEYNLNLPADVTTFEIKGNLESNAATVTGLQEYTVSEDLKEISVMVTSEAGDLRIYKIYVTQEEMVSANIINLDVQDYELDPEFHKDEVEYYLTVNNETTSLNLDVTLEDSAASYEVINNHDFIVGMNNVIIRVTAKDNVTTKDYTLYVNRQMSTNNYLLNISVNEGTLTPIFDKETHEYTVDVPRNIENINITAITEDASATITSGTGAHNLVVGENVINIRVKSSIGIYRNYKVTVNRLKSDNNYLSDLVVKSGSEEFKFNEDFNKKDNNYTLTVPSNISSLMIIGTKEDLTATVNGNGLKEIKVGDNTYEITVISESGLENTYTIIITHEAEQNNNVINIVPSIGSLTATENNTITSFDPEIKEYNLVIPATENMLSFTVTTESKKATVTGDQPETIMEMESTRTIVITSEAGTDNTYIFHVIKELESEAKLASLTITDYPFEFDPDTFVYNLNMSAAKKKLLASEITAIPKDSEATVNLMGDLELTPGIINIYTIEVIAKDGYTTQTYTLNITTDDPEYTLVTNVYDINRNEKFDYVIGILPSTNILDFKNNFENDNADLVIYDTKDTVITDETKLVGTGYTIKLEKNNKVYDELKVIIRGDLNSDGRVNVNDQVRLINYVGKVLKLNDYEMLASDLNFDGRVNVNDQVRIINYVGKVITTNDLNPKK